MIMESTIITENNLTTNATASGNVIVVGRHQKNARYAEGRQSRRKEKRTPIVINMRSEYYYEFST